MRARSTRAAVAAGATTALVAGAVVAADAAVVTPPTPRQGSLVQVGPSADNGFPTWYRDSRGVRLEGCWQNDDQLCGPLPDEVPDPDSPTSFPDNFPGEHFYQLAGAAVVAGAAGEVSIGMDLEGAWANEEVVDGDQMVFGRIRIRAKDAAPGEYRITHPYGVDEFSVAAGDGGINMTEDVGTTPGAFGQALQGRVGPFLTWDTFVPNDPTPGGPGEPPAGYVGDPTVEHAVTGSPYGTNVLRVEHRAADGSWEVLGQTDLFTVQGRLARNSGVDGQVATYRRLPDGRTLVDVFATSETGEAISVRAPGLGQRRLPMAEDLVETVVGGATTTAGRYFARFAVPAGTAVTGGADATTLQVQNTGDVPVASETLRLQDVVAVGTASHDGERLVVEASSSDPTAVLTATGLGQLVDGRLELAEVDAPPPVVTVTSSEGGSATVPLVAGGPASEADPPLAVVTVTPSLPVVGRPVTLDASGSLDATAFEWTTLSTPEGAVLELDDVVAPTFTPEVAGTYDVEVVAVGDGGRRSVPLPVSVTVDAAAAPVVAAVGPDQSARRGARVVLDGTASTGAVAYAWQQVPPSPLEPLSPATTATLSGATTAQPSFTVPLLPLPAAPGPNPGYVAQSTTPLLFELTATGADGATSTATARVTTTTDALTGITARYRTRGEWRISGTSSVLAGQRVALVLGSATDATGQPSPTSARGRVVGVATVDATGAFTYRGGGPDPRTAPAATTLTAVSALGGQAIAPVTVTS
ncbi:hypothetical protein WDV85_04970 [Pseudokineococcus sp. 5B2Z-1]|uniref:hypothetical protein n=1 Tax=Pseudokineococcus sp. 5B2Z-1 TaxID=3132744 RepID=UPI0030A9DA70